MSHHARPHLSTHTRGHGQSAVAGAAYRLGLKLYDQRAGKWHDFRRRALGEEIVRAVTIAPEGAPEWATDPGELWNRVEVAEKRKDAQVARDYRIPIPLGLTDQQAGDMAEAMARFIAKELTTPVSMGLHRDGAVDVLGNPKPSEKQGFHAHLYFPTRKIEELDDGSGGRSWGMGAKLVALSNRRTSGVVLEAFNQHWAALSNDMAEKLGLAMAYDHRSYVRQGLEIVPRPKMCQASSAMERKGIATRKGDALRAVIAKPEDALQIATAIVFDVRRLEDTSRSTVANGTDSGPIVHPPIVLSPATVPTVAQGPVGVPLLNDQSLAERFRTLFGHLAQGDAQMPSVRVMQIVHRIERALEGLLFLAARLLRRQGQRGQHVAERQDILSRLERARASRAAARETAREWEAEHPLWAAGARWLGQSHRAKPVAWKALLDQAENCDRRVQELKAEMHAQQVHLVAFDVRDGELKTEQATKHRELEASLEALSGECPASMEALMAAATQSEREVLKNALPDVATALAISEQAPELALNIARARTAPRM